MTVAEAAWLAGFFDGEGSIVKFKGGRYKSECWKLCISNTDKAALDHVQEITGVGSVSLKKVEGVRRAQWQWQIGAKLDMESLILQMLPYLRVKTDKSHELLAFVERTR